MAEVVLFYHPQGPYQPRRMTGIALESSNVRSDHTELRARGVDVDEDGNQLMIVQAQSS